MIGRRTTVKLNKIINLKTFGAILIIALAVCLFMSKTIYTKNLPTVTAALPASGALNSDDNSNENSILVPNEAIFDDGNGKYVYQIKKRKGILGDEFYLYALKVQLGNSDETNTLVIGGMEYLEPVVISSNKPLADDTIVKVDNENDFYVDY